MSDPTSIVFVIALSSVPLFVERLRFLREPDHSAWVSFSGGAAIAYVFVYVLPKLGHKQLVLASAAAEHPILHYFHNHAYLAALAGFVVYFGVALVAERLEQAPEAQRTTAAVMAGFESLHVAGFAAYNLLIGYLVADLPQRALAPLLLFTVIMLLHCMGRDHTLARRYGALYRRAIRWILVAALFVGWAIGNLTAVPAASVALWFAFLAGSITLNVIEEELPRRHHGRFGPFVGGAALFAALLLLFERSLHLDLP